MKDIVSVFIVACAVVVAPYMSLASPTRDLIRAVAKGDIEMVKNALDRGADINEDPLIMGADNVEIVQLLLNRGGDVNALNQKGETALMSAARYNRPEVVQLLLEKGANVNVVGHYGYTALLYAVEADSLEVVQILLEHGADVTARNNDGKTALILATYSSSHKNTMEIVKLLLQYGADINAHEEDGDTAFTQAIGHNKIEWVHLLLEHNVDVHFRDEHGRTPLMLAASSYSGHANKEMLALLLQYGADVYAKSNKGSTASAIVSNIYVNNRGDEEAERFLKLEEQRVANLLKAAGENDIETIKQLLQELVSFVKANVKNERGQTALLIAAQQNALEAAAFLLEQEADTNIKDENGASALRLAVENNNLEMTQLLLEHGADSNEGDNTRQSVLMIAAQKNAVDIVQLLLTHGADPQKEFLASITTGDVDLAQMWLEQGVDANTRDENGRTALMRATQRENLQIVKLLLTHKADVNAKTAYHETALFFAARTSPQVLSRLLQAGAEANAQDKDGVTPLMHAAEVNSGENIKLLIEHGADIHIKNSDGNTAIIIAVENNAAGAVDTLLTYGADAGGAGETESPLAILAVESHAIDVIRVLSEHQIDLDTQDPMEKTALMTAVEKAIGENTLDMVSLLLEYGVNVNAQTKTGITALHLTIPKQHIKGDIDATAAKQINSMSLEENLAVAKLLLTHGANVNMQTYDGWTPLALSTYNNAVELARLFIEYGADVNMQSDSGMTPLIAAAMSGNIELAKILIANGADLNAQFDKAIATALDGDFQGMVGFLEHIKQRRIEEEQLQAQQEQEQQLQEEFQQQIAAINGEGAENQLYVLGYEYEKTNPQFAIMAYQEILERFPASDVAIKAIERLDVLGDSSSQIIKTDNEAVAAILASETFNTPESTIEYFIECVKNEDYDCALRACAIDEIAEGYNYEAMIKRFGAMLPGIQFLPSEYKMYVASNKRSAEYFIMRQLAWMTLSVILPEEYREFIKMAPLQEKNINFEEVVNDMNPQKILNIEIDEISKARMLDSKRQQENLEKQAKMCGAEAATSRAVLYNIDGDYYVGGFQLLKYNNSWLITALNDVLIKQLGNGALIRVHTKTKVDEMLEE